MMIDETEDFDSQSAQLGMNKRKTGSDRRKNRSKRPRFNSLSLPQNSSNNMPNKGSQSAPSSPMASGDNTKNWEHMNGHLENNINGPLNKKRKIENMNENGDENADEKLDSEVAGINSLKINGEKNENSSVPNFKKAKNPSTVKNMNSPVKNNGKLEENKFIREKVIKWIREPGRRK